MREAGIMKHTLRILGGLAVIVLLAAACSGGGDAATTTANLSPGALTASTTFAAATTTMPAFAEASPGESGGDLSAARDAYTNAGEVIAVVQTGRSIIFTANLEVEVADVIAAGEQAQAAVAGLGGVLFGQETTTGAEAHSVLTIKVPPENFTEALHRLSGIGQLVSQSIYADDVTERVVDLQSRITTAEASVERLRTFLEGAESVQAVAALEAELLQRETDLELLRGELRTVQDQVALATIVLTLSEPAPDPLVELVATAYAGHNDGAGCPGNEELALDEGDLFTMCYEVRNTGDTLLGDVEVWDSGLDARFQDLIVVAGDPTVPLAPGGHFIFAFEGKADPDQWTSPQVQATALDANGNPLWEQVSVADIQAASLQVTRDTSLPGFGDALSSAWHGLQRLAGVAVVVGGGLVPWLWVPALLVLVWWWQRRRRRTAAAGPAPQPPPPPAASSGTDAG
jgi:hypothetical protein